MADEPTDQISARIEVRLIKQLDDFRKADNRSRAYIIRLAIVEFLEKHKIQE